MLILIKKYLIILILLFAFLLRFYQIDSYPSLNPDEAALGYNAYSLIITGKDEHGVSWPIHFKSFGDYKPGGYVYLDLPFTFLFGLNSLATRLPNLLLSVLSIFFFYKLIVLLSNSNKLAIIASFLLSVSPWHIHFSRGAWESSTALSLLLIGIYYFYLHLKSQKLVHLYLSIILIISTLYIYHSARLIAPLLTLALLLLNYRFFISNIKKYIFPLLLAVLLCLPVLLSFLNNGGTARFGGVGITADYGPISRSEELLNHHQNVKLINRITHNRRVLYFLSWAEKYASHFDLNFLFINGDEVPRSKSPEMGQLYLIELPLLLFGIFSIFKNPKYKNLKLLTLLWLLISPLASSLTFQAPSALRALPMVIPLIVLIAIGLDSINFSYFFIIFYPFFILYFLDAYFIHQQQRYPFANNLGTKEIVDYINIHKNQYQNIYLTDKYDQPYILYLYFSKYEPSKIQSQIKLTPPDKFGFSTVNQIDNITFHIPSNIPSNSLVIEASDYHLTQKSFKIYTK